MFTRFRFKNLKTWAEQLWNPGIELAPVTLFLGTNSAGKTSILQVPLLLKQTFESADRTLDLNLGGQPTDFIDLGSYESAVHKHDTKRELGFGLSVIRSGDEHSQTEVTHEATYQWISGATTLQNLKIASGQSEFTATRQSKGGYLLSAPGYTPKKVNQRFEARRSFQPERSVSFTADAIAEFGTNGSLLQDLSLKLMQAMGDIVYLGPLRESPARSYMWNGTEPGVLGKRGEFAVAALLASDNSRKRRKDGIEGGQRWLVEKVSGWLKRIGVAERLELVHFGSSRHYEIVIHRGKEKANIVDVGFGISQVLPMLVLAYFVPRGTTIIAEQPEIHLHPCAQGGLAELMVEVATERNVQFLVETHSEHMFRRLQTLVATERFPHEKCRLYFVHDRGDGRELEELRMDAFGRIKNWPAEFFGDAVGEVERQMDEMMRRMRKDK